MIREYIALTKPGIQSLLLFTTLCAMMVAAEGAPPLGVTILTMIGGYLAAGGANALNCYIDRDIDGIMGRTRKRGTVTGAIAPNNALAFGLALSVLSVLVFGFGVNWLAAGLALAGNVYYVVVYTWMLKRRTPQNIVIGGAAGSFPPLVGWAAVTGNLSVLPFLMFAIIYYWTPPHFWALALNKTRDYGNAGVPMMPNVHGVTETKRQMLLYTLMLIPLTVMPAIVGLQGIFYGVAASLLGLRFIHLVVKIVREEGVTPTTWRLYKYSLSYLALLFTAMAVDRYVPFGQPSRPVAHIILDEPGEVIPLGDANAPAAGHEGH